MLEQDKGRLEQLAADQLSCGHSDGRVESKAKFIDGVMTRMAIVKSTLFPNSPSRWSATRRSRHLFEAESETDGKPASIKIGALQVWQKQDGTWKLA